MLEPVRNIDLTAASPDAPATPCAAGSARLRTTLGCFATGVAVVSTLGSAGPVGLTINSFASVSLDPPLVLWSIRLGSRLAPLFVPGCEFAVSVLHEHQEAVARRFAGRDSGGFAGLACVPGPRGIPLVPGAIATLFCSVEGCQDAGDHRVLIARVGHHESRPGAPLVFARGAYRSLGPLA